MSITSNIPTSKGVSFANPSMLFSRFYGVVKEKNSPPNRVPAPRLFDFKAVMIFLCVVIPIFRMEDDHFCDKHCCQFYKHTDKHKNKTTLIRFVEYSRGFHNSDASIVLVQPIVWVMRVLFSSSNVSHHSGGPQSSSHSVTPFSKASTQPSAKYCHVGKD